MKARRAPLIALSVLSLLGAFLPPAWTQSAGLPAVNMGKYVHQPGDNQYSPQTQQVRHGPPPQAFVPAAPVFSGGGGGGGGGSGWHPTAPPPRPDISLDPIAADEPVPPAGFPPLPERFDLPVASAWRGGGAGGYGGGGGGGGGYGGGSAPGMSGGGYQPPMPTGTHQHYQHFSPGAFMPPQQQGGGGGGGGGGGADPSNQPAGSHGYYKARSPEYFNANTSSGGVPGMGGGGPSDAERALRGLGKEPKLNDRTDNTQAPEAPAPVVINQATTQDLSLPEDEFSYRPNNNRPGVMKNVGRNMGRRMLAPLNSVGGVTGIHF